MVPLRYRLKSGDTVEVDHLGAADAREGLGEFRRSPRAPRAASGNGCAQQQAERSRELGIALIDRELEPLGLDGHATARAANASSRRSRNFLSAMSTACWPRSAMASLPPPNCWRRLLTPDELKLYRGEKTPAPPRRSRQRSRGARDAPRRQRQCGHRLGCRRHAGALCAMLQSAAGRGDHRIHHARARRHGASRGMSACDGDRSAASRAGGLEGRRGNLAPDPARSDVCRSVPGCSLRCPRRSPPAELTSRPRRSRTPATMDARYRCSS